MNLGHVGKTIGKGAAGLGAGGSLALVALIGPWEGRVHTPYLDVGGVLTVCDGITGSQVVEGKTYTDQECDDLSAEHVQIAANAVKRVIKTNLPVETEAAFISFTYNVGANALQYSTLARKANSGDLRGACYELSRWVYVRKTKVRGLENRRTYGDGSRISERTMCLIGLDPNYRTPLFETYMVRYRDWRSRNKPQEIENVQPQSI